MDNNILKGRCSVQFQIIFHIRTKATNALSLSVLSHVISQGARPNYTIPFCCIIGYEVGFNTEFYLFNLRLFVYPT